MSDDPMTPMNSQEPSVRDAFTRDHGRLQRSLDELRRARSIDPAHALTLFRTFRQDLEQHMHREEKVLFATIERRMGRGGPTAVMHADHRRILRALDRLERRLATGDSRCEEEEASLIEILEAHEFKEERILYPIVDRLLDAAERRRLLADLERLPAQGAPACCE